MKPDGRGLSMFVLVVLALVLAACAGPAATSPVEPTAVIPVTGATQPAPAVPTTLPGAEITNPAPTQAAQATAAPTMAMAPTLEGDLMVEVDDQAIQNGTVTVHEVKIGGPGWVVIHTDNGGKPGPVIGFAGVQAGETKDVVVEIDASKATPILHAMLHVDAGTAGAYEFPGPDAPVTIGDAIVMAPFTVREGSQGSGGGRDDTGYGAETPAAAPAGTITLKVGEASDLGKFLVDEQGMTLYLYTKDTPNVSNCSGGCLVAWPPLYTSGEVKAGEGVDQSKIGVITLADGRQQVTYNQLPLYYYVEDAKPGDVTGQNVGNVWFVVAP